jgi:hypothetical protein
MPPIYGEFGVLLLGLPHDCSIEMVGYYWLAMKNCTQANPGARIIQN